jgi:hypothetical protein
MMQNHDIFCLIYIYKFDIYLNKKIKVYKYFSIEYDYYLFLQIYGSNEL